jgi:hypothetical protein
MNTYLPSCMASNPILSAIRTTYLTAKSPRLSEIEHRSYSLYGLKEELSIMASNAIAHYRTDLNSVVTGYPDSYSCFLLEFQEKTLKYSQDTTRNLSILSCGLKLHFLRNKPSICTDRRVFICSRLPGIYPRAQLFRPFSTVLIFFCVFFALLVNLCGPHGKKYVRNAEQFDVLINEQRSPIYAMYNLSQLQLKYHT